MGRYTAVSSEQPSGKRPRSAKLVAAGVVLLVLAVAAVVLLVRSGGSAPSAAPPAPTFTVGPAVPDPSGPAKGAPNATTTVPPAPTATTSTPPPTPTAATAGPQQPVSTSGAPLGRPKVVVQPPASGGQADPAAVASAFILAYTQRSFQDVTPNSWVDRAAVYTTPAYSAELHTTYADSEGDLAWTAFVRASAKITTKVTSTAVVEEAGHTPTGQVLRVNYIRNTSSAAAPDGTDAPAALTVLMRLVNGVWLVSNSGQGG